LRSERIIRSLFLLAVAAIVTGCSALRLGYNQGHDLVFWWLDGYVDFTAEQSPRVREALRGWFAWHRATQLPDYAALLRQAQQQVLEPARAEQICRWADVLQQRATVAVEQALPWLGDVVLGLTPAQLAHLEQRFAKANVEFREEFLQGDAAARRRVQFERQLGRFENLYGRLEPAQRERLAQWMADSPADAERWFGERLQRQQELLDTLRAVQALPVAERTPARVQPMLAAVAQRFTTSPREAYREHQQRLKRFNCELFARVHNDTTPAQRQRAAAKLRGWEDDARVLAGANGG
jgi:hypothetical protein